jgi:tetratricopeptide (TPR) repeat protein
MSDSCEGGTDAVSDEEYGAHDDDYGMWDLQTQERLRNTLCPTPEDYIGAETSLDGVRYKVDSVLGTGGFMVVFKLMNMDTGQCDQVLKVFREEFDAETILIKKYKKAMENLKHDPDLVIKISERLLELRPNDDAILFNKASAHCQKKEYQQALDCYDLAIAQAPDDLYNWLAKAATLSQLGRYSEAVDHLATAHSIDAGWVRAYYQEMDFQAAAVKESLREVLKHHSQDQQASQLLRELF